MYGIIDCDNCYVSCERVFRPDLNGKPVVVLSNNDGCVVARSNEAKAMGIKAGTPYFQLAEQFPNQKIAVFSSNYELYGELTGRVVSIIRQDSKGGDEKGQSGFDILLTHSPCRGYGDMEDLPHRGFECFNYLLNKYSPQLHCYGHVHREYGRIERTIMHPSGTLLINGSGHHIIDFGKP